ncbi:hypothetical protein Esi_0049_0138 [Ectocarpus siliculosus]|uniref:Uncharacterized protein n=1 Tax=Ectocarpus siliculosus TaxID=2880 RepID=D7G313_ECTSI|nr:hypothetical protein Esi_0049_0138 [Ectocarpus siliculosus]|eukprot:CBJ48870.1 hypothetical protein Esi_0049_0138 [Ectocarpus siliculosus]
MATAWSGTTASAGSGFVERSERRHRLGYTCPPDPGRAASLQQLRPEAHREGKASPPAAAATPGGHRAAATPFSSRRRRRPDNNTTAEEQDGTTTTPQAGQAPSISPTRVPHVGDRHELDDDDNGGVTGAGTGLPAGAAGGLWRSRGRHREPRGPPRRRHSGNSTGSVGSFDSDRYFTTAVRCDRFGYPLHERECLGSYGAGAGLSGGRGPRYSPMIKGLPDFYESRPKRQSRDDESLGRRTHGNNREAQACRSASLYQRTTEWRAKASEVRARKLAQREEQELRDCTFQPNVPLRGALVSGSVTRAAEPIGHGHDCVGRSSSCKPVENDDEGNGSGGNACGGDVHVDAGGTCGVNGGGGGGGCGGNHGGEAGEGTAAGPRSVEKETRSCMSSRAVSSPSQGRGCPGNNVVQRLFDETRRLDERRFEGQERKNMAAEEEYARTCTFQPSLVQGKSTSATIRVASRYRDPPRAASAPPAGRRRDFDQEDLIFHPKILGVQPGMTRALEYDYTDADEDSELDEGRREASRSPARPERHQRDRNGRRCLEDHETNNHRHRHSDDDDGDSSGSDDNLTDAGRFRDGGGGEGSRNQSRRGRSRDDDR